MSSSDIQKQQWLTMFVKPSNNQACAAGAMIINIYINQYCQHTPRADEPAHKLKADTKT